MINLGNKFVEKEKTLDGKAVSVKVNITSQETNYGSVQVLFDEIKRDILLVVKYLQPV